MGAYKQYRTQCSPVRKRSTPEALYTASQVGGIFLKVAPIQCCLPARAAPFPAVCQITRKRQEDDASGREYIASVFVAWKYAHYFTSEDEGKNKGPTNPAVRNE